MIDPYILFDKARRQGPNPFTIESVIADKEVWGEVMTNLPDLNQHVDQKVYQAISEVHRKYSSKIGISIKGDRGTGKSHAIHRIWKTIEREGKCVFAYIGPFKNPSRIDSHVRRYLSISFSHQDIQGVTQWQKLAIAAINTLRGTEFKDKYSPYLERCDNPDELRRYVVATHGKDKLRDFFDELVEEILENQSGLDFDFLKAVLFSILKNAAIAQIALAWIRGEDHPDFKKAGLPELSLEQQEEKSIWIIQQICRLAEVALLPVTICFDQLDSSETSSDCGDSPAQVVAKCIDRIYFHCGNVILLCCVIGDTWREIEQMGSGIPDRVGQWSVTAKPPTTEQIVELVQLRLNWFYKEHNLKSSDYPELYPFEKDEIMAVAREAVGARNLLKKWCGEKFETAQILSVDVGAQNEKKENGPLDKRKRELLDIYNELLEKISASARDDEKLAAVIARIMRMIPEGGAENVVINQVEALDSVTHGLHLIISGYDLSHQKDVRIGIRVCETTNGRTFNAVMRRLLDYKKHRLTRGCLVRSTPIPLSWKLGNQLKHQLVSQQAGEVVVLKKDEIKPLVVLEKIYEDAENYGFDKEELIGLMKELKLSANNPLICEILSAPA